MHDRKAIYVNHTINIGCRLSDDLDLFQVRRCLNQCEYFYFSLQYKMSSFIIQNQNNI